MQSHSIGTNNELTELTGHKPVNNENQQGHSHKHETQRKHANHGLCGLGRYELWQKSEKEDAELRIENI
jgi:hypothetical protein